MPECSLSGQVRGRQERAAMSDRADNGRMTPAGPPWLPEAVTRAEVLAKLAELPAARAARIAARLRPMPSAPKDSGLQAGPPVYVSWEDYLAKTSLPERRRWCATKAKKANAPRLMSGTPSERISTEDVWGVLDAAQGRCALCGSLAVEPRPSLPSGTPLPWEHVGRRIGSLGHVVARVHGGANTRANMSWSCLWCNTWRDQRISGAADHGAIL